MNEGFGVHLSGCLRFAELLAHPVGYSASAYKSLVSGLIRLLVYAEYWGLLAVFGGLLQQCPVSSFAE